MFGCIGVYPSARAGDQHHRLRRQLSERGDSSRWHKRFLARSAAQRAKIVREVEAVFSNASALTAVSENVSAADIAWAKEFLPVVLSWLI
jgi:hypothetical protein